MEKILKKHLKGLVKKEEFAAFSSTANLRDDLGLDSMKFILLLTKVCDDLKLKMTDLDANSIMQVSTSGELMDYLEKAKSAN